MKLQFCFLLLFAVQTAQTQAQTTPSFTTIFDGKIFTGWEGDTLHTWHIVQGALAGGSLAETIEHNQFLATTERFDDFELTMQFKLEGTGFVNAGVQFHSERLKDPAHEMTGYQADLGDGYWASLYDESRRNVTIVRPNPALIQKILHPGKWNLYTIRSEGRQIKIWLNKVLTVDYTEPDESIPHTGRIALQVHGGGKALASYKNIQIKRLIPSTSAQ
jgi:Domain of Unknown Function (DUF1080)